MLFNNAFDSSYEELISFYPMFYRNVLEMRAILEAQGKLADDVMGRMEKGFANAFLQDADEAMVARYEKFLGITAAEGKPLDERKATVISYFAGFGKVSASGLKDIIKSYTNSDIDIKFEPADEHGNNRLDIAIPNPKRDFEPQAVLDLLAKRLPAHLWYKVNIRKDHSGTMFIGFVLRLTKKVSIGCNPTTFDPATFLADEDGNILANEAGAWLSI